MILSTKVRRPCNVCHEWCEIGTKVVLVRGTEGVSHPACKKPQGYAPRTSVKLPDGAIRCGHTTEGPDFKTDGSIILQCVKVKHEKGACFFVNWSMIGEDSPEEKRWAKYSKALEIKKEGDS